MHGSIYFSTHSPEKRKNLISLALTHIPAVRAAISAILPRVTLPEMLIEVDHWVNLRSCFTHPQTRGTWSVHPDHADQTLFAGLVALGCNLPLRSMADAANVPYHQLIHTTDWYIREECLRQAIVRLIDYHYRLPLSQACGSGTAAMSDGIRFGVAADALHARYSPKLPVRRHGITLYDMVSNQGSQPYIDVIRCDMREAPAALDAALHHQTELPLREHMTDTHGYTDLMFGLFELESRVFSPRIRDLSAQVLYPMRRDHKHGTLGKLFRGPVIQPERIIDQWDAMHRIAASLKDGTVSATLLVTKFHALKRHHGGQRGIQELGRIFKTLAALTYISDADYRRRIQHTLNRGELLHALAREVFFGQQGMFREPDIEAHIHRATSLSVLLNVIIVWNTRYMMLAIDHLRATGMSITPADLGYLSPIRWEHITLHGTYDFNLVRPQGTELRPLRGIQTTESSEHSPAASFE